MALEASLDPFWLRANPNQKGWPTGCSCALLSCCLLVGGDPVLERS